ncbi:MAG: hypothetical protein Q4D81_14910, partial [Eubacteriales bacterium]|nr:hypothetical protein [Eubacteriales bacterium]
PDAAGTTGTPDAAGTSAAAYKNAQNPPKKNVRFRSNIRLIYVEYVFCEIRSNKCFLVLTIALDSDIISKTRLLALISVEC